MWENITQKDFKSYLNLYENEKVFSRENMHDKGLTRILDILYKYGTESEKTFRLIAENYSKKIEENDNDRLRYYKRNNVIISLAEDYDIFEEDYVYTLIAYELKK